MPFVITHGGRSQVGLAGAAGRAQGKAAATEKNNALFAAAFDQGLRLGAGAMEAKINREHETERDQKRYDNQVELETLSNDARVLREQQEREFKAEQEELDRQGAMERIREQEAGDDRRESMQQWGNAVKAAGSTVRGVAETVRKGIDDSGDRAIAQQNADTAAKRAKTYDDREKRAADGAAIKAKAQEAKDAKKAADDVRRQTMSDAQRNLIYQRAGTQDPSKMAPLYLGALAHVEKSGTIPKDVLDDLVAGETGTPAQKLTASERGAADLARMMPKAALQIAGAVTKNPGDGKLIPTQNAAQMKLALLRLPFDTRVSYDELQNAHKELSSSNAPPEILQPIEQRLAEFKVRRQQTVIPAAVKAADERVSAQLGSLKGLSMAKEAGDRILESELSRNGVSREEFEEWLYMMEQQSNHLLAPSAGGQR